MCSLKAEAPNAEQIEHLVKPVKDLFGAVFFVSVGMLVNPPLLVEYAVPILCITTVTIIGLLLTSTIGVMASGQNLKIALRCGFSLGQIGEFSFIIASLGMGLGVISEFLYPIIVAVSVITTFTTPFFISAAEPAYAVLIKLLPQTVLKVLERYTESEINSSQDSDWQKFIKAYCTHMLIFLTLLTAIAAVSEHYLLPYLNGFLSGRWGSWLTALITLAAMSPILRAILMNSSVNSELFAVLWFKKRTNHFPLLILLLFKILSAAAALFFVFHTLIGLSGYLTALAMAAAAYCISSSDWLLGEYLRIESRFLVNLNEKHMRRHRQASNGTASQSWFDEDLCLAWYRVPQDSRLAGKTLSQTAIRKLFGCNIFQVRPDGNSSNVVDMPGGSHVITGNALLHIIGTADQLQLLDAAIASKQIPSLELVEKMISMRSFMLRADAQEPEKRFFSCAITIDRHSSLLGKTIKAANIRDKWHCLVIGLERGNYTMTNPNVSLVFETGDLLWVLGKQKMLNSLIRHEML